MQIFFCKFNLKPRINLCTATNDARYWQSFQTYVHPFYPVLVAVDGFGQELMHFLHYRQLRNQEENLDRISQEQLSEPSSSWIALLFVVIACGVQFADGESQRARNGSRYPLNAGRNWTQNQRLSRTESPGSQWSPFRWQLL